MGVGQGYEMQPQEGTLPPPTCVIPISVSGNCAGLLRLLLSPPSLALHLHHLGAMGQISRVNSHF